jgi:hypothetical protein
MHTETATQLSMAANKDIFLNISALTIFAFAACMFIAFVIGYLSE